MIPKNIKGKIFNGQSLSFFINIWLNQINLKKIPKFEFLWENVIKNDIEVYKAFRILL